MKEIIINRSALESNIKYIKNLIKTTTMFCAVVKSNAYGHNIKKIVEYTNKYVNYYAVISIKEALSIRNELPRKNILILSKLDKESLQEAILNNIEISVFDLQYLKEISLITQKLQIKAKLHIKINTGMNRYGVRNRSELVKIIDYCNTNHNLKIVGIYTHFATSNNKKFLTRQMKSWNDILASIPTKNYIIHGSASALTLKNFHQRFDMVRIGLAMYGYGDVHLRPVLSLRSKIVQINKIKRGEFVGYDADFIARTNTVIGVVDIGYGDGYMRLNAKRGYVLINGVRCKIIGKICMNSLFVNLSNCKNVQKGDTVILIGRDKEKEITATHLAKWCKTIEYEILTNLSD